MLYQKDSFPRLPTKVMQQALSRVSSKTLDSCLKNPNRFYHTISNEQLLNKLSRSIKFPTRMNVKHSTMPEDKYQGTSPIIADSQNQIFVQRNLERESMTISFNYDLNGKTKQFNLYRPTTETLSSSLERIKLNILKLDKRSQAKSQEPSGDVKNTVDVDLLIDGSIVNPSNTKNGEAWVEGAVLELNGKPYRVRTNSPQVESINLPSCMMINFIIMPIINLINCNISDCEISWYRRISVNEREKMQDDVRKQLDFDGKFYWHKVSSEMYYCPKDEDVAHYLKIVCLPADGEKRGLEYCCISRSPIEICPSNCPFEKRHLLTREKTLKPDECRVVSYNILADIYADSNYSRTDLFGHCPSYALDLEYRRQLLLKEISGYNADLICLQEVDRKEFLRAYQPFLKHVGNYSGVFNTKGEIPEGQATFYRDDKYECVDSHRTILSSLIIPPVTEESIADTNHELGGAIKTEELTRVQGSKQDPQMHPFLNERESPEARKCLSKFDEIRSAILLNQELKKRVADRHTILQTTLLKSKELDDGFMIVANTHLYFAPDADHVRLLQGSICLKYLEHIKDYYRDILLTKGHKHPRLSIIFCGDMNSTPDCGLYKLATQGRVTDDLPDWSSNKEEAVVGLKVETQLRFSSAYENIKYTNYTLKFNGCLDYIYYDRDAFICESTIPLPSHEDVTAIGGIPSDVFPSDHIALVANLKYSE